MEHFSKAEFRGWYDQLDPKLRLFLDALREELGYAVMISPAHGAIGRHAGRSYSHHNIDRWGKVEAVDIMPLIVEPKRWIEVAKKVGFTGIGFYPDWKLRGKSKPGLHVDVRQQTRIATWGAYRDSRGIQRYITLRKALYIHAKRTSLYNMAQY